MTRNEEREKASKEFAKKNPYIFYSDLEDGDYDDADAVYDFKAPAIIFAKGAEWADKTMIDKACEYLRGLTRFVCCSEGGGVEQPVFTDAEIELFKHKITEE